MIEISNDTPWRRVYHAFSPRNQSDFGRMLDFDRSKISRVLADDKGLINGRDQERILEKAAHFSVNIDPAIMVPVHP